MLIVDDSRSIRERLTNALSALPGLKVVAEAGNGLEALAAIRKHAPDVVTLDIRMPKVNGLEVLTAIKTAGCKCRVIVLSGFLDEAYRKQCLRLGAADFFDKVTELDEFYEAMRRLTCH